MPTKFVFFDLGNVLVRFSIDRLINQVSEVLGANRETTKDILFSDDLARKSETGQVSQDMFFEHICSKVDSKPNPDKLLAAVNDIFWLNEPIVPITARLFEIGIPTGVLSNTSPWHWDYCKATFPTILRYIPGNHVLSFNAGAMKPDPAIYEYAFGIASRAVPKIERSEILFLDDLENNVAGAKQFGFAAVQYFPDSHDSISLLENFIF